MKAIETRYLGPTNTRGSRIKASDEDGNSVTMSYDDANSSEENHAAVCKALCEKMGWPGVMLGGHTKAGMVWVFERGAPRCNGEPKIFADGK